jgi:hypothetical protein
MVPGEELTIPLYIFSGDSLIHIGEGSISKTKEFYHGAFDFNVTYPRKLNLMELDYELYLVYGPKAERISIGEVVFSNRSKENEFFGCFELKSTPELNMAMDTPRSLTNRSY